MKRSLVITFIIIAVTCAVGWRNHDQLASARQALEKLRQQARLQGIPDASSQNPSHRTRSRQNPPTDTAATARNLIDFARELEEDAETSDTGVLDDRDQRMLDWQRRLLALEPEEMNRLLAEIGEARELDYESRRQLLLMICTTFAQSHPGAALEVVAASPDLLPDDWDRAVVVSSALIRGMETDPAMSTDWWKKHSDLFPSESKKAVTERLIRSTSLFNPEAAFKLIGELGNLDPAYAVSMITNPARTIEQRDATLAAFREYLTTVEDPKLRKSLHFEGVSSMISSALLDGVESGTRKLGEGKFSQEEIEEYAFRTSRHFREGDAAKWIEWLSKNLPEESVSKKIVPQVLFDWARLDYQAAGEWITRQQDGPVKAAATATYASTLAEQKPEIAAHWVSTVPPGEQRDYILNNIHQSWKRKDPAAAAAFAEQNGIPK